VAGRGIVVINAAVAEIPWPAPRCPSGGK
jgi:hypothetical protein